ncbi:hypothetical protein N7492_010368 [Penicillium capsulatum]|uniref:Mid2 domain-containing protein n=1 Tax=Penicillium capsulatum TaxID=69766 RepID=A0A9W9HL63_9EURO|nr:hypothetical protein N7492_010368 [Penicillium capsulatum]KAJ6112872.1 hypothetical protein N7512_008196 [Penicillium capsulatum]
MARLLPWLVFIFPNLGFTWGSGCYAPNGDKAEDYISPCIAIEGQHSMCCRLNDTNVDTCHKTGLCYFTSENRYYRDHCTDPSWNSPNCLKNLCVDDKDGGSSSGGTEVQFCPDSPGKWCCGSSPSCCTKDKMFTLKSPLVNIGGNATATTTVTATAAGGANSDGSSSSTKVAIGVGVGVPLGVIAIAMLGAGFWWGGRKTAAKYEALRSDYQPTVTSGTDMEPAKQIQETEANPPRMELPTGDENTRSGY